MIKDDNKKPINKKLEIKSNSDVYEIYLGTFDDNTFTWYSISKHKDPTEAYKEFKKYVNTQLKYTDEELKKVWDTGRLDVELRQGNKLLNWVGIYSREVKALSEAEEKEAEEAKQKKDKKSKKDAVVQNIPEYFDKLIYALDYELDRIMDEFESAGIKNRPELEVYKKDGGIVFAVIGLERDDAYDVIMNAVKKANMSDKLDMSIREAPEKLTTELVVDAWWVE